MFKKYTLLTIVGLSMTTSQINCSSKEKPQSGINWIMIWPNLKKHTENGCDSVRYESYKYNGKFIVEVAAGGCGHAYKNLMSKYCAEDLKCCKDEIITNYKQLSHARETKDAQEFYRCMSELENPATAVETGEYRKCVKIAWNHRPWFTPATIDVRENTEEMSMCRMCRFGRFERKDLSKEWGF